MIASESSKLPARLAGALWLLIIACGIFAEVGVRMRLFVPGDAAATAERILAAPGLLRLGFLADSAMFLADVALAALLYVLLRPAGRAAAAVAAAFRLAQAAVLALNLLHQHAALLILDDRAVGAAFAPEQVQALAHLALDVHRHGYDLALFPFGVHCLLLGALILRSALLPRALGALAIAAGAVYLAGSTVRFAAPALVDSIQPIYAVALVAELALGGWLLFRGTRIPE